MKRFTAMVVKLCLIVSLIPAFALQTSAAAGTAYDPEAALAYAQAEWDSGVGVCDQFVKACLAAGGVKVYAGDVEPVMNALLDAGYATGKQQLTVNGVYVYESENQGKVSTGDVIFFKCAQCNDYTHTVMASGFNADGQLEIYGHNPAQESYAYLGTFYHETDAGVKHDGLEVWVVNMSTKAPDHEHVLWYDGEGGGVGKYEDAHPHEMYDECTVAGCGLKYKLGWTATVTTCPVCNPSPNGVPEVTLTLPATGGVRVAWTALENVSEYQVWRAKKENGTFTQIPYTGTAAYMTNASVSEGVTYYYKVIAVLEDGTEIESAVKSITVGGELDKPELTVALNEAYKPTLTWTAVESADGYDVCRAESEDGQFTRKVTVGPAVTSYTNTDAVAGNVYYYKVIARVGDKTSESEVKSIYYPEEGMSSSGKPEVTLASTESGGVKATWTALSGASEYQLWRAKSKDGTYFTIGSPVAGTQLTNSSVLSGVKYYYKVSATLANGQVVTGDPVAIVTMGETDKPTLTVTANEENRPSLDWSKVDGVDGYQVFRSERADGDFTRLITTSSGTLAYTNTAVVAGTTYYYKVAAMFGETLGESDVVAFEYPADAMSATGKPEVTLTLTESGGVQATWTALEKVSEYQLWRAKREFGTYYQIGEGTNGTQITNENVLPGVTYYYKVIAVLTDGNQVYGYPAAVTVGGQIARPELTVEFTEVGKPVLSWTSVSNVDGYQVFRSESQDGEYQLMITTGPSATSYTNTGAEAGKTYYYKVAAMFGDSLGESEVQEVICPALVGTPTIKAANSLASGKPVISWTAVEDATGYELYCSNELDGTYKKIYTAAATKLSVNHNGAQAGQQYFYKVRAVKGEAKGEFTEPVSKWGRLARPTVKVTNRASDGKPYITWTAVEGATGYKVYRCDTSGGTYKLMYTAKADRLYVTHTGAVAGNDYFYKVVAVYGDNTACNSFMTAAKGVWCDLKQPAVKVTNRASDGKPYITWSAVDGATGYKVYRCDTSSGTYKLMYTAKADRLYVTHTGAVAGNDYFYKVQAIHSNSKCSSALSGYKGVWCDLARPTLNVELNSKGKPYLSWNEVDGADGYKVYRSTDGKTYSLMYTAKATKLNVTHTGAASGTTYYYKVLAVCDTTSKSNSAYSTVKSITCK